jgi:hypothetical protein
MAKTNRMPSDQRTIETETRDERVRARKMDIMAWLFELNTELASAMELDLVAQEQEALTAEMTVQGSEIQKIVASGAADREVPQVIALRLVTLIVSRSGSCNPISATAGGPS